MPQLSMHLHLPSLCTAEPLMRLSRAQVTEVTVMQRGYTARPSDPQTLPCAGMCAGSQPCYPMTNHRAQSTVQPAGPLPAGWQGEEASPALGGPSSDHLSRHRRKTVPSGCAPRVPAITQGQQQQQERGRPAGGYLSLSLPSLPLSSLHQPSSHMATALGSGGTLCLLAAG